MGQVILTRGKAGQLSRVEVLCTKGVLVGRRWEFFSRNRISSNPYYSYNVNRDYALTWLDLPPQSVHPVPLTELFTGSTLRLFEKESWKDGFLDGPVE